MNIKQALSLIPEYVMLRPNVDIWYGGDETLRPEGKWIPAVETCAFDLGEVIEDGINRRRIPKAIRQAMAHRMLQFSGSNGFLYPFEVWLLATAQDRK